MENRIFSATFLLQLSLDAGDQLFPLLVHLILRVEQRAPLVVALRFERLEQLLALGELVGTYNDFRRLERLELPLLDCGVVGAGTPAAGTAERTTPLAPVRSKIGSSKDIRRPNPIQVPSLSASTIMTSTNEFGP